MYQRTSGQILIVSQLGSSKVISLSGQTGSGGSVRSASASRALSRGASLEEVLSAGDWARESTFRLFYYKPGPFSFVDSVLS